MTNKKFRSERLEYVGTRAGRNGIEVFCQKQVAQGPAGWIDVGRPHVVTVPWGTIASPQYQDHIGRAAQRSLIEHWSGEPVPDDPLF